MNSDFVSNNMFQDCRSVAYKTDVPEAPPDLRQSELPHTNPHVIGEGQCEVFEGGLGI